MHLALVLVQLQLALFAHAACAPGQSSGNVTGTASTPASAASISSASATVSGGNALESVVQLDLTAVNTTNATITWPQDYHWYTIGQPSVIQWTWTGDKTAVLGIDLMNDDLLNGERILLTPKVLAKQYSFKANNNSIDKARPGTGYQIVLYDAGFYSYKRTTGKLSGSVYAVSKPFEIKARGESPNIPFPYAMPTAYPSTPIELGTFNSATTACARVGLGVGVVALAVAVGAVLV